MLSAELLSYKTKEVRDLAWSIFSPVIINNEEVVDGLTFLNFYISKSEVRSWLKNLDNSPQHFLSFIEEHKSAKRLGKYFEIILFYYFNNCSEIKNIHFSLQVKKSKELTLGEFDFLLQSSANNSWTHLEVAVKFYLAVDGSRGRNQLGKTELLYLGPNAKDRLDLKLDKLVNKQMRLGDTMEGKQDLSNIGIQEIEQSLLVKGYLFYPLKRFNKAKTPDYISEYCWKGWWSYFNEFPFIEYGEKQFVILQKLEWLSPFFGEESRVINALEIQKQVESKKTELPILLAEVEFNGSLWAEINRGFLVVEGWNK